MNIDFDELSMYIALICFVIFGLGFSIIILLEQRKRKIHPELYEKEQKECEEKERMKVQLETARKIMEEQEAQKERNIFNSQIVDLIDAEENTEIQDAYKKVFSLPDKTDVEFEFKRFIWNDGYLRTAHEIDEMLDFLKAKEYYNSETYERRQQFWNFWWLIPIIWYFVNLLLIYITDQICLYFNINLIMNSSDSLVISTFPFWGVIIAILAICIGQSIISSNRIRIAKKYNLKNAIEIIKKESAKKGAAIGLMAGITLSCARDINHKFKDIVKPSEHL